MTARTEGRNTRSRLAQAISALVDTGVTVYAGCMATLLTATGEAVNAGAASAGNCVGVFDKTVLGDGVETVEIKAGCFQFGNSGGGDAIAKGDIGAIAWIADNQTVSKNDKTKGIAGAVVDVDADGVWVLIGPGAVGPQGEPGA